MEDRTPIQSVSGTTTSQIMLHKMYGGKIPRLHQVFLATLAFSVIGLWVAFTLFKVHPGITSIFLIILGLIPTFTLLIQRNKHGENMLKTLGGTKRNQLKADLRLTQAVLVLFLGMMLAYSATALLLPPETMKEVFYYQLEPWLHIESPDYQNLHAWTLIHHNLMVALASFILSLIYRIGGTLLVLAWNASVWGTVFAYFAQLQGNSMEAFVGDYLAMIACVFPHIVLEALGYIAATLAGLVAVRICISYGETDFKKKEAVKQLIGFAVVCVGTIFLAGTLEVTLAPFLFGLLSNT